MGQASITAACPDRLNHSADLGGVSADARQQTSQAPSGYREQARHMTCALLLGPRSGTICNADRAEQPQHVACTSHAGLSSSSSSSSSLLAPALNPALKALQPIKWSEHALRHGGQGQHEHNLYSRRRAGHSCTCFHVVHYNSLSLWTQCSSCSAGVPD